MDEGQNTNAYIHRIVVFLLDTYDHTLLINRIHYCILVFHFNYTLRYISMTHMDLTDCVGLSQ